MLFLFPFPIIPLNEYITFFNLETQNNQQGDCMGQKSKADLKCCFAGLVIVLIMIGTGITWTIVETYAKPESTINFSLGSFQNGTRMITVTDGTTVEVNLEANNSVWVWLLAESEYYEKLGGNSYFYEGKIDGSSTGSFQANSLSAGNYYFYYTTDAQPSTGKIVYTIDTGVYPGQTFLIVSVILSAVIMILAIIISIKHGAKIKVVDKYGKEIR